MSTLSSASGLCSCNLMAVQVLAPSGAPANCLEHDTVPPRSVCSTPKQQCSLLVVRASDEKSEKRRILNIALHGCPQWRRAFVTLEVVRRPYLRSYADASDELPSFTKSMAFADAIRNEINIPSTGSPLCSLRGVPGLCSMLNRRPACKTHEPGVAHLPNTDQRSESHNSDNERQCKQKLARCTAKAGIAWRYSPESLSPAKTRRNSALASHFAYRAGGRAVARRIPQTGWWTAGQEIPRPKHCFRGVRRRLRGAAVG